MFDSATEVEVGDTPISRIGTTMHTILYDIYKELKKTSLLTFTSYL